MPTPLPSRGYAIGSKRCLALSVGRIAMFHWCSAASQCLDSIQSRADAIQHNYNVSTLWSPQSPVIALILVALPALYSSMIINACAALGGPLPTSSFAG